MGLFIRWYINLLHTIHLCTHVEWHLVTIQCDPFESVSSQCLWQLLPSSFRRRTALNNLLIICLPWLQMQVEPMLQYSSFILCWTLSASGFYIFYFNGNDEIWWSITCIFVHKMTVCSYFIHFCMYLITYSAYSLCPNNVKKKGSLWSLSRMYFILQSLGLRGFLFNI